MSVVSQNWPSDRKFYNISQRKPSLGVPQGQWVSLTANECPSWPVGVPPGQWVSLMSVNGSDSDHEQGARQSVKTPLCCESPVVLALHDSFGTCLVQLLRALFILACYFKHCAEVVLSDSHVSQPQNNGLSTKAKRCAGFPGRERFIGRCRSLPSQNLFSQKGLRQWMFAQAAAKKDAQLPSENPTGWVSCTRKSSEVETDFPQELWDDEAGTTAQGRREPFETCTRACIIQFGALFMGASKDIFKEGRKMGRKGSKKVGRQATLVFAGRFQDKDKSVSKWKHDEGLREYDEVDGISVGFDPGLLISFLGRDKEKEVEEKVEKKEEVGSKVKAEKREMGMEVLGPKLSSDLEEQSESWKPGYETRNNDVKAYVGEVPLVPLLSALTFFGFLGVRAISKRLIYMTMYSQALNVPIMLCELPGSHLDASSKKTHRKKLVNSHHRESFKVRCSESDNSA
ncbi:hypothetical protein A6R68_18537 [Neotoma lepida]|uniref:Uncharacterized protein n=1 Tax=Neotoma lepida TaxID=56216 RepID=A0A1A6HKP5_NEOLE|nr:hypothetical protein A6R68_18537 [Neotoma lepida]